MRNRFIIGSVLLLILVLSGCTGGEKELCCLKDSDICMGMEEAREIGNAECEGGTLKDTYVCNNNTGTWWFDFKPDEEKEGCNPACVVNVETKQAEINWRCTGLVQPTLSGTEWKLKSFGSDKGEKPVLPDTEITLRFEEEQFSGSAGCNHYFGSFDVEDGGIVMKDIGMTEMWCEGRMEQEYEYLSALQNVTSFVIDEEGLKLFHDNKVLSFILGD